MPTRVAVTGAGTGAGAGSSSSSSTARDAHLWVDLVPSPAAIESHLARSQTHGAVHASEDEAAEEEDDNTVYLSPALWDRIAPPHKQSRHRGPSSSPSDLRIAVAITPSASASPSSSSGSSSRAPQTPGLPSIIAWARPRASTPAATAQGEALSITYPPSLIQHLPTPPPSVLSQRSPATAASLNYAKASIESYFPPLSLSAVYLAALDSPSFDFANSEEGASLQAKLTDRILRQGELLQLSAGVSTLAGSNQLRYRVIMAEPILQGVVKDLSIASPSIAAAPASPETVDIPAAPSSDVETEIMVLLQPESDDFQSDLRADTSGVSSSSASSSALSDQDPSDATMDNNADDLDLSIDEGFLGSSVLHTSAPPSPFENGATRSEPSAEDSGIESESTQPASQIRIHPRRIFDPALLDSQSPVQQVIAAWQAATAKDDQDVESDIEAIDDHAVVLIPAGRFSQLGCFNGDWAVIELTSERIGRVVRVFAHPNPPSSSSRWSKRTAVVYMSPLLHQNLHRPQHYEPTRSTSPAHIIPIDAHSQASIAASLSAGKQAGSTSDSARTMPLASCPLPIPFAESLTISRLASPLALDRAYQSLFLDALRTYFQPPSPEVSGPSSTTKSVGTKRRIVRDGQIIAVGIQKGKVRFARDARANAVVAGGGEEGEVQQNGASAGGVGEDDKEEGGDDDVSSAEYPAGPSTGIVYFRITALAPEVTEPEPLPSITVGPNGMPIPDSRTSASNGNSSSSNGGGGSAGIGAQAFWDEAHFLVRDRARRGEYGCVVDPEYTKMVQTGLENGRVADLASWLGVYSSSPVCPQSGVLPASVSLQSGQSGAAEAAPTFPSTALTAPGTSPYDKLTHLVQATLLPCAQDFGLHLSVLIKGARGSGKKTIVRWVAQRCGVHLLELNCYDLLSDTDARTEGVLRARFEKAASCGPAILLLQNIEALARKSQALESGQEPLLAGVLADCIKSLRKAGERRRRKLQLSRAAAQKKEGSDGQPAQVNGSSGKGPSEEADEEEDNDEIPLPVAVFATTSDTDKCPTSVLGCFKHEVAINAPNEAERLEILQTSVRGTALYPDVSLKSLATQTAALVAADLVDLVGRAKLAAMARLQKHFGEHAWSVANAAAAGIALSGADFEVALNKARASYSESIGAPKIPNVTWDDVGGLASVKNDILDTIQLPLEHPELFSDGLKKRSGILLYGPPGTGKTLLAKAVATSCSLNFFSVKGPELLNMYIGESEANVRRVFQKARDAKPCVIFFDELDSVAPKRGNQGDSGGVMDRIVSQLLAELDGMAGGGDGSDVFVIGATNRPDLLDPALLRPGRFDRMLYLSVSETHDAQLNILQALTRKFKLDPDLGDLSVIANQCPFNLTGADFYALCSDAMLKAMTRKASEVDEKLVKLNAEHPLRPRLAAEASAPTAQVYPHPFPITPQYYLAEMAQPSEIEVRVNRVDFEAALRELVPSVSEQEMEHYRAVQSKFSSPDKDQVKGKKPQASHPAPARSDGKTLTNGPQFLNGPAVPNGVGDGVLMPFVQESEAAAPALASAGSKGKGKGKQKA